MDYDDCHEEIDERDEAYAEGYARCKADVVAHGKHGKYRSLTPFLVSIIAGEHIGAAEHAKGES